MKARFIELCELLSQLDRREGGIGGHMQVRDEYCRIGRRVMELFDSYTLTRYLIQSDCHMSDQFDRLRFLPPEN